MKQVLIRRGSPVVVDVPAPLLTNNSVLVEVYCSLISTGTEIAGIANSPKSIVREALENPAKVRRGIRMIRETGIQRTMTLVNNEMENALPSGYSCAGKVIAAGKDVQGLSIGDRVACAGAGKANHAEIVAVPENLVVKLPADCDYESAASGTLGAIAVQGVRRADLRFGEFAAVIGLGLIGQLTVQLLNVAGCRTIGIDVDPARVETAKRFGVNTGDVMAFTGGMGADAVIITASSNSDRILQEAMQMVRRKGRVVVVGAVPLELDRSPFYEKEADLLISCSYGPGRYDATYEERGVDYPYAYVRWTENRNMAEYLRLVAERRIDFKSLIEKTWPLEQAPQAYDDLKQNRRLAVVLTSAEGSTDAKLRTRVDVNSSWKVDGKKIRLGIVGPGSFVKAVHLPNLKKMGSDFAIEAISSRTGSAAWNIARQYGARYESTDADELFRDTKLNAILIASRHNLHASQAIAAAKAGKAILLEKPAAMNAVELEELLDVVRNSGMPFMVGFNRRFSPMMEKAKSLLDKRSNPAVITYRMNAGAVPADSWIQTEEGGGRVIGEACHIFDLFNYLIGHSPVEVVAMPLQSPHGGVLPTDNFSATLRYADGSLCTLNYTSLGSTDMPKEAMEAFFDGKSITMEDYRTMSFFGIAAKPISKTHQDKGHAAELQAFANYLQKRGPAPMTLEEIEAATRTSILVDELVRRCAE